MKNKNINQKLVGLVLLLGLIYSPWARGFEFNENFEKNFGLKAENLKSSVAAFLKQNSELTKILTSDEITAIYAYTAGASINLNQGLRSKDKKTLDEVADFSALIKAGLSKLPDYKGNAYRGTQLPPEILKQYKKGNTVSDPAFLSASLVGQFPGPHRMKIKSKTGKIISPFSENPNEVEVLFAPGTQFKVIKVKVDPGSILVFDLEEL